MILMPCVLKHLSLLSGGSERALHMARADARPELPDRYVCLYVHGRWADVTQKTGVFVCLFVLFALSLSSLFSLLSSLFSIPPLSLSVCLSVDSL